MYRVSCNRVRSTLLTLLYFYHHSQLRDADRHHERHQSSAVNRSYAELVKWQGHAIRLPLLRLPNDLAPLALECFDCILRYCGDIPLDPELTEVKCVYTVLMVSQRQYSIIKYLRFWCWLSSMVT